MTITPFILGVLCTFAAEAILAFIVGLISHLIGKVNEGKMAKQTLDNLFEKFGNKGSNDGRINE